jgi:hypothetical protein
MKGNIVYHAALPSSAGVCDVMAMIMEHWLVYLYLGGGFAGVGQSKWYIKSYRLNFMKASKRMIKLCTTDDKVKRYDFWDFQELLII